MWDVCPGETEYRLRPQVADPTLHENPFIAAVLSRLMDQQRQHELASQPEMQHVLQRLAAVSVVQGPPYILKDASQVAVGCWAGNGRSPWCLRTESISSTSTAYELSLHLTAKGWTHVVVDKKRRKALMASPYVVGTSPKDPVCVHRSLSFSSVLASSFDMSKVSARGLRSILSRSGTLLEGRRLCCQHTCMHWRTQRTTRNLYRTLLKYQLMRHCWVRKRLAPQSCQAQKEEGHCLLALLKRRTSLNHCMARSQLHLVRRLRIRTTETLEMVSL